MRRFNQDLISLLCQLAYSFRTTPKTRQQLFDLLNASRKRNLIDEMLNHLPHYRDVKDDGMVFYEFSADHYMFSNYLLDYLPTIFEDTQEIIIENSD